LWHATDVSKHRSPPTSPTFQLPTRRRWNVADAERVLAAIERSGTTIEDFAREHGLRAQRIDLWRRRLGHRTGTGAAFQEIASATVSAALEAAPKFTLDLLFRDGRVLRFDAGVAVDRLGAIVRALAEADRC